VQADGWHSQFKLSTSRGARAYLDIPLSSTSRRKQKHRGTVLARSRDPKKGIALLFEPTAKEKFQVETVAMHGES